MLAYIDENVRKRALLNAQEALELKSLTNPTKDELGLGAARKCVEIILNSSLQKKFGEKSNLKLLELIAECDAAGLIDNDTKKDMHAIRIAANASIHGEELFKSTRNRAWDAFDRIVKQLQPSTALHTCAPPPPTKPITEIFPIITGQSYTAKQANVPPVLELEPTAVKNYGVVPEPKGTSLLPALILFAAIGIIWYAGQDLSSPSSPQYEDSFLSNRPIGYAPQRQMNVRNLPTAEGSQIIAQLSSLDPFQGQPVRGVDPTTRWVKIEGQNGMIGYIWEGGLVPYTRNRNNTQVDSQTGQGNNVDRPVSNPSRSAISQREKRNTEEKADSAKYERPAARKPEPLINCTLPSLGDEPPRDVRLPLEQCLAQSGLVE